MFGKKQNVLLSPHLEKKRKKERNKKIIFFLICVLVVIFLPAYVASLPSLNIQAVEIRGNTVTENATLQSIIDRNISGRYLGLYSKSNILIFPSHAIKSEILFSIKRIGNVSFSRPNAHSLVVTIAERNPHALWCRQTPDEKCFFVDDNGYIFADAPNFSDNVYFKYFGVITTDNPVGQQFQTPADFSSIDNFVNASRALNLQPKNLTVEDSGDLSLSIMKDGNILANKDDLSKTISNLQSFLGGDQFKNDPTAMSRISYIDLRFGNKVYFKFKQ